ncbi:MAG TPA: thioredoxin domain-containing protein [Thermoleophilaceae bacterium]
MRAEREAQAAAAAAAERRKRRLWQVGATLVVAAALVGAAIAISTSSEDEPAKPPVETRRLLAGIPQRGVELGRAEAPVTMVEFADLQCPFCREYAVGAFPELVRRYVRAGKVKMVFRSLAFLGPDSEKAARVAAAAGLQNKLWDVVDRFYQQQGRENSGWVTNAFVERLGRQVPGLDLERALAARDTPAVTSQLRQADAQAKALGVSSTPTFYLQKGTGKPEELDVSSFDVSEFARRIDAALGSG